MTGIEKLRRLSRMWTHDCKVLVEQKKLESIADQIECEMPEQEDREAIAWVREHGGLDHVRSQWGYLKGRANHADHVDRQLEKRQRQIDECHDALRRRNEDREQYVKANERLLERGAELHRQLLKAQGDALEKDCNLAETKNDIREVCLAHGIDVPSGGDALDAIDMRLHDMQKALDKRPMPEGMEWLVEAWPRFEDGEPVRIGDEVETANGQAQKVRCMKLMGSTFCLCDMFGVSFYQSCYRNSVKRPTPKVLDADGAEIRVGDRVWSTQLDEPHEWIVIDPHGDRDDSQTVLVSIGDRTGRARPENLTHRTPVIAADGRPLRVGDTVYGVNGGCKYTVAGFNPTTDEDGDPCVMVVCKNESECRCDIPSNCLTHQRPVLDADGVPIKVGDTVYFTDGREQECNTVVHAKYDYKDEPYVQLGRLNEVGYPTYTNCSCIDPSQLTHERPDSYDALWDDIENCAVGYSEFMRRAKALAERDAE